MNPFEVYRRITITDDRAPRKLDGGWFIAVGDCDGFVTLHGPYWDDKTLVEKFRELDALESARVNVIPVEGITASP